jgi:hypothetical protein
MKRYLILKGCAGLGNRLYTISYAIEYAQKTNRTLLVDWSDGQFGKYGENVFYKYFDLEGIDYIESLNEINDYDNLSKYPEVWGNNRQKKLYDLYVQDNSKWLRKIPKRFIPRGNISKLYEYWRYKGDKYTTGELSDLAALESLFSKEDIPFGGKYKYSMKEDIVFFADFCPVFDHNILKNRITLKDNVKIEIDDFLKKHNFLKNTIGVHVRFTDKVPDKDVSYIFDKINSIDLDKFKIFLATDNLEIQNEFQEKYKNIIVYNNNLKPLTSIDRGIHQWGLDNNDGDYNINMLKESIIDMWLLSKCEILFYQGNSSFSGVSKILHEDQSNVYNWQA